MIDKQEFLDTVQKQIFPILQEHQGKIKKYRWRTKVLSVIFISLAVLFPSLYIHFCTNHNKFVFCLLGVLPMVALVGVLETFHSYCNRIKNIVKPKVFYLLGVDNNTHFDNPLKELSNTGIFPCFDYEELADSFEGITIDDCFTVQSTKHYLLVQKVDGLAEERDRNKGKERRNIFSGVIIMANQLCFKDFSLLVLDKKAQKPNLSEAKIQWQKIGEGLPDSEFLFYTDNQQTGSKYLTETFLSVIKEIKDRGEGSLNILFHNGKIFLTFSIYQNMFECIDLANFSDIEPYEKLYDEIQSLHQIDDLLTELEKN